MSQRNRFVPAVAASLLFSALLPLADPAAALDRGAERELYRAAMTAIERSPGDGWMRLAMDIQDYPLMPYLELAALRRGRTPVSRTAVEAFVKRWPGSLPARELRESTLRTLAKEGDWPGFRSLWADSQAHDLRCAWLRARIAAGEKPVWSDIETLWMQPRPTPAICDPLFDWARSNGELSDAAIWRRIEAAAAAANPGTVTTIAAQLSGADKAAAERIAAAVNDPAGVLAKASAWTDTARARDAVSFAMLRFARRDSGAAETRWAELGSRFKWDVAQKNRVLNALAVYRSTSYSADALTRLKALPADAADDTSREWHVRVALAAQDWNETLAALDALGDAQKADERWRYLRARVLGKLGRKDEAAPLFAALAREANFHGFLAADWTGQPYSICPQPLAADRASEQALLAQPDLARAFEFHAMGEHENARREWDFAMGKLAADQRRLAADIAYRHDWFDRAIFALSSSPDTLRHYEQRFPLARRTRVTRSARETGIDPAWAYAIIRAESAWMIDARSHADAYGLMQLLPGVAKEVAGRAGLPYAKPGDLFDPELNIQLGTRFLAQMARQYSGSPWLASAAYNAGGRPVGRWVDARGALEPDFFIETIPYKETREYVGRVLAFSVIYDWRLHGKVIPLAARMPRVGQAYQAPKDETQRKAVLCAQTP